MGNMDVSMAGEGCEEKRPSRVADEAVEETASECPEVVEEPETEKPVTKRFRAENALKHPPFPVLLMRMFNKAKHDPMKRNAIIDQISKTYMIPKHKVGGPVKSALDKLRKSRKIIEIKRGEWLKIAGNMRQLNTLQVSGKISLPRARRAPQKAESQASVSSKKSTKSTKKTTKKRKRGRN